MTTFLQTAVAALMGLQAPAPGSTLTLAEAEALALRNSIGVRISQSQAEGARQRAAAANGRLGPQIGIGANYTRFDREVSSRFSIPGGPTINNIVQPIDSATASASLQLPIDITGNIRRIVRASQANARAAEITIEATQNDLRLDVRSAFFSVLQAQEGLAVADQAVVNAEESVKNARALDAEGTVDPIVLRRFETQLESARVDREIARNRVAQARAAFNTVLNIPVELDVNVAPIGEIPPAPERSTELIAVAQQQRPEVRALQRTVEALGLIRRSEEQGLLPSLGVNVNYQRNLKTVGTQRRDSGSATLSLSWPIFDSGITRANVRAAREDERQAELQLEQVRTGVALEVQSAFLNLRSARERLELALAQEKLAQETLRLANVRRRNEVGTFLEVVDAQTQLTAAQAGVVNARYDYLSAYAALQRALGRDTLTGSNP